MNDDTELTIMHKTNQKGSVSEDDGVEISIATREADTAPILPNPEVNTETKADTSVNAGEAFGANDGENNVPGANDELNKANSLPLEHQDDLEKEDIEYPLPSPSISEMSPPTPPAINTKA